MNFRRVDLNLLTVFDAIYSEGNLTRAAQRIGMSQPAMSNALARLRHLVGDELFARDGRGIKATARAVAIAPLVREALSLVAVALEPGSRFDPTQHRRFSVAGFDYFEVIILPGLKRRIDVRAPSIDLRSATGTSAEFAKSLRYGDIDLIIDYVPLTDPEYQVEALYSEQLVAMARRGLAERIGPLDVDTFVAQRFLFREDRPDEPKPEVDQILAEMGKSRDIALSVTNWLALPVLLAESDLLCTCPRHIAHLYAEKFDLTVMPLPFVLRSLPVYMIWHRSQDRNPAHRWLRAQVKQVCRLL